MRASTFDLYAVMLEVGFDPETAWHLAVRLSWQGVQAVPVDPFR